MVFIHILTFTHGSRVMIVGHFAGEKGHEKKLAGTTPS